MEKIDVLRNSIKNNQFISEELKCNIATLTDLIVTVFPEYDCSNLEKSLSNLKIISNNTINDYSSYNKETNTLDINVDNIFNDRIDLQHLFLIELLKTNSNNDIIGFNNGMAETIASLMNSDESMKKLYPLESLSASLLSKVVDPITLINGYMNNDIESIIVELDSIGISNEEAYGLLNKFNTLPDSFDEIEIMISNMYAKKVKNGLDNGEITYDDMSTKFGEFESMLVTSKSDLIVMYPFYSFEKVKNLNNVKTNFDLSVTNIEDMQMIDVNEKTK